MRVPLPAAMITKSNAMSFSFFRTLIIGALVLLLAGCSALRLGYGQAPTLAYWWLDRYVDFDAAQSERVRDGLQGWFRWHRANQVASLADLLARAQREALAPATPAQFCAWADELTTRLNQALEPALPMMAEVAVSLQPAQLQHLERRYERNNASFAEEQLQPLPAARLKASVARSVDRAESFYGRLDEPQRAVIARGVAASPFDAAAALAERRARQQDILANLRRWHSETTPPEQVRAGIRVLTANALRSPRDSYRGYQQRLLDYNCKFAADIHNATTPQQRQHAARKLRGWESDLRSIASEQPD